MSSRGIPEVLFQKVDEYVDSLAPQIQPRIANELELFQQKTIDSLETQVIDAFRSLFNKDKSSSSDGSRDAYFNDSAPNAYGGQSLPFADEIAKLTRSFGQISDEAGGDLRDIFALTEGRGGGANQERSWSQNEDFSSGARGFLSSAINAVQDHLDNNNNNQGPGGQGFQIGGLLGVLSDTLKDASRNPEEKARLISPEIKASVGDKLRSQHASIAEQFTRIALDHIKRWLRGNTSTRDLGDGAKAEIADQVGDLVKGLGSLFGSKKSSNEESARGFDDSNRSESSSGGGFSRVISDKLSTGLAKVHREVRLEFRRVLGAIEKQLFELLPDQFQRPLEKILGGNPFDSQLDRDASGSSDRGFGDDIKSRLLAKVRGLVQKMQETLRESILGVINGGHRRFERESWVFVQSMVEQKVQRYLPDVKIDVPDDIGNENVSVGNPNQSSQFGGPPNPSTQTNRPPESGMHQGGPSPGVHTDGPAYEGGGHMGGSYNSGGYSSGPPYQGGGRMGGPPEQGRYDGPSYQGGQHMGGPPSYQGGGGGPRYQGGGGDAPYQGGGHMGGPPDQGRYDDRPPYQGGNMGGPPYQGGGYSSGQHPPPQDDWRR